MRMTDEHVRAFAEASGDHNPMHLDPGYARRSPWGEPIVPGAVLAVAALGRLSEVESRELTAVTTVFRKPVEVGSRIPLAPVVRRAPGRIEIEVRHAGQSAASVTCARTAAGAWVPAEGEWHPLEYRPWPRALREFADLLGAHHVPESLLAWLAVASWFAGTWCPGPSGLLTRVRLTVDGPPRGSRAIRYAVGSTDERTGASGARMRWRGPEGCALIDVDGFRFTPVPRPTRRSVSEHIGDGAPLRGARIAVVGGSRGLGASIAGACALAGARVWAGYHRGGADARRLRAEFGTDRLRPWRCDATDPASLAAAAAAARAEAGELDGVVLCASAPLRSTASVPAALPHLLDHVDDALRMAIVPSVSLLPLLRRDSGWVAYVSSAAVDDPPPGWAHYTAAKLAAEHHCHELARSRGHPLLLLRPPRMWTDLTNGPTARWASAPPERIAAELVRWAVNPPRGTTVLAAARYDHDPAERAALDAVTEEMGNTSCLQRSAVSRTSN